MIQTIFRWKSKISRCFKTKSSLISLSMAEKEEEKTHPAQFWIPDNSLHVKFHLSIAIRVLKLTISDNVLVELI